MEDGPRRPTQPSQREKRGGLEGLVAVGCGDAVGFEILGR